MTSSQPRSKQESRASSVATSQSHRNPNDSKNLSRQSSTGRSTTKSSSVSTNANRKGEKEPSVEVSRSSVPVSEDDERPQPSPRRPTAAYVNRNNDRDGSEVGTTSRTASEAGTQRSFKTAVSAQTKATTAANREESHVKTPSERSATRSVPASEATNPHTAVVREEEELSDIGTQRSFKTAVSAQTKATTAANREESRIKTPSERSVSRSVPASEATNPHTTVTDTNKEHTPAASTRKSSTRNSSVAGSSPSPAVVREEEELSDIGTQRSFKTAVSAPDQGDHCSEQRGVSVPRPPVNGVLQGLSLLPRRPTLKPPPRERAP
ncbi:hypothetical protein ADEAN_000756600 [Angomonas deanei]|uniref:Uncharacterized protein n=1 Tax=Angomonas deanei TaxID=59799 RepID=A0A7G2CPE3_9TRYP|nr:hypothetical protein ADEAN_000756600 [Angomonas deanei]